MINKFKLGVNFDKKLLDEIIKVNSSFDNCKVSELYGSNKETAQLAARPEFRLPDVTMEEISQYVKKAARAGIDFNFTLNSFMPFGNKKDLYNHRDEVVYLIHQLEEIGVKRITIANPLMLEIIRNHAKSDIEIEISTCMHIDTITQIKYLYEKYGVRKICNNLNKNRDFVFLEKASDYCNKNGIIFELMVNEFCGVGANGYATHCIYRDSCYMCHATNISLADSLLFDNYPMNLCTHSRDTDVVNWLRMKWIRPEDIKIYNQIGINHFKITGRTGSTDYIINTLKAYMSQNFEGNLLNLWKPLESIYNEVNEYDVQKMYVDNKKLDGFLDFWYHKKHNCDNEVCGETCKYCEQFYNKRILEGGK